MKCYRIRNWDTDRENAETRKYVDLLWFRNKVKLLGEGLGYTLDQKEPDGRQGPFLYGMFKLIEQVAAGGRVNERGWLFRNGSPMDAKRIASLLRQPVAYVEQALKFFSTQPMDWIELAELPEDFTGILTTGGSSPGDSPSNLPPNRDDAQTAGRISASNNQSPLKNQRKVQVTNNKVASPVDSAAAEFQKRQFGAVKGRIEELEQIPDDDRTSEQERELKKMRELLKAIQKKQRAGDFTPVQEEK